MTEPPASPSAEPQGLREIYRRQLLGSLGGWSGTVIAAVPTLVFVAINALWGLHWAVVAAVASAVALAAYRLLRRQSVQQALSGLLGVVIAALIAARTGHAKGYFLFGIVTSFVYAGVFLATLTARRPLIGLLWEFLDPYETDDGEGHAPVPWYKRATLLRAYDLATGLAAVIFLARGVVQLALFRDNATGWLAVARIAMGYPLYAAALVFGLWVINRARRGLSVSDGRGLSVSDEGAAQSPTADDHPATGDGDEPPVPRAANDG